MFIHSVFRSCNMYVWLFLAGTVAIAWAAIWDNEVVGQPVVQCAQDGLSFEMSTSKPFTGQLYVRNEYGKSECTADFGSTHMPLGSMDLKFTDCGMRRQRLLNPPGLSYSVTLMAKFHSIFVTSADRAYLVRCFYKETEQEVSHGLSVSPLSTAAIDNDFAAPECKYEIRHADLDGPQAGFVRVGDHVVHVFSCNNADIYGILVKNCFVDDGKESKEMVIGDDGCPIDYDIMHTPFYTLDNEVAQAIAEATVFKWPDRPAVYFSCQIKLCVRSQGECQGLTFVRKAVFKWPDRPAVYFSCQIKLCVRSQGECQGLTPPRCLKARKRLRRRHKRSDETLELDLEIKKLIVLDLDDLAQAGGHPAFTIGGAASSEVPSHSTVASSTASNFTTLPAATFPMHADSDSDQFVITTTNSSRTLPATAVSSAPSASTEYVQGIMEFGNRTVSTNTFFTSTVSNLPKKDVAVANSYSDQHTSQQQSSTRHFMEQEASSEEEALNYHHKVRGMPDVKSLGTPKQSRDQRQKTPFWPFAFPSSLDNAASDRICYGPELLAAFTFLVTVVGLALVALTVRFLLPYLRRYLQILATSPKISEVVNTHFSSVVSSVAPSTKAESLSGDHDTIYNRFGGSTTYESTNEASNTENRNFLAWRKAYGCGV